MRRHKPGRPLDTNVEYYTALLLEALEIPRSAFTALFAVGRTAGWCAHIFEQEKGGHHPPAVELRRAAALTPSPWSRRRTHGCRRRHRSLKGRTVEEGVRADLPSRISKNQA